MFRLDWTKTIIGSVLVAATWLIWSGSQPIDGIPEEIRSIITSAPIAFIADSSVIDVKVWPESVTIFAGDSATGGCYEWAYPCQAQFYAAWLAEDGTFGCSMDGKSLDTLVAYNAVYYPDACDSAIAMLDFSLLQDTLRYDRYARFTWISQPDSVVESGYTLVEYHILIRNTTTGNYLMDSTVVHPDTQMIWLDGVPETYYDVAVYTIGATADTAIAAARSTWVTFLYPSPLDSIVVRLVAPIELPPVQVDTITGDTIPYFLR
jgi:hypothetical protein